MPYRVITLPFDPERELFDEKPLNDFCLNKQVVSQWVEFFHQNGRSYWSIFLEYESLQEAKRPEEEIDLNGFQKLLFQRLREWRKELAEKQGVPVYVIADNRMLKTLAVDQPKSLESMKEIKGMGGKKIEKYGKTLLDIIQTFSQNEE